MKKDDIAVGLLLVVVTIIFFAYILCSQGNRVEAFEVYPSIGERIVNLYHEVLSRPPTSKELIESARALKSNQLTWDGLRQRLMDADEYMMNIKLQSNQITPELKKMMSDSRIIAEISNIYLHVIKRDIESEMILPMRDIYIALSYNPFALVAMLSDSKYPAFEEDLLREEDLDKKITLDLFTRTFDQPALMTKAAELAKQPDARNIMNLLQTHITANPDAASKGMSTILTVEEQQRLRNVLATYNEFADTLRSIDEMDTDMTDMLTKLQEEIAEINKTSPSDPTHEGGMVLRPEYAWSVPQRRAPVCTIPGQPPIIQPLLSDSKLMLGTPLCEADQTQVGSIMPKFQYKEVNE